MRTFIITIIAFVLATVGPTAAHHNWLQLLPPEVSGDAGLLIACFGHALPLGDSPPPIEDYDEVVLITPDGQKRPVSRLIPLGIPSVVVVDLSEPGLWGAASGREHYGCQTTEGYQRGRRKDVEAKGFTVVESKHTFRYGKTYTSVGAGAQTGLLRVGHDLEMVPDASLAHLQAGDRLELVVRLDGQPKAGMIVSGTREGSSEELAHPEEQEKFLVTGTTDENGRVSLPLEEGGRWFFITEQVVDNPEPGVDKLFRSATLTLPVEQGLPLEER